jgi:hypothetical protein
MAVPALLDRVDELLSDGTLTTDPPNAATLEVLTSVRLLDAIEDLHPLVSTHPCAAVAHELFPRYPGSLPPFLPADWLPQAATA